MPYRLYSELYQTPDPARSLTRRSDRIDHRHRRCSYDGCRIKEREAPVFDPAYAGLGKVYFCRQCLKIFDSYLILQVVSIVSFLIGGIISLITPDHVTAEGEAKLTKGEEGAIMFVAALIQGFFLYVIIRCYHFLKEKTYVCN